MGHAQGGAQGFTPKSWVWSDERCERLKIPEPGSKDMSKSFQMALDNSYLRPEDVDYLCTTPIHSRPDGQKRNPSDQERLRESRL